VIHGRDEGVRLTPDEARKIAAAKLAELIA
jgi:hypothetical protein